MCLQTNTNLPRWTSTTVRINSIDTSAPIHTTALCTILIVRLTPYPRETQWTCASVRIHILVTGGAIVARTGQAFVYINFAVFPLETVDTETRVVANIVQTCASILARNYKRKKLLKFKIYFLKILWELKMQNYLTPNRFLILGFLETKKIKPTFKLCCLFKTNSWNVFLIKFSV